MELLSFINYKEKSTVSKAKKGDKEAFLALINENRLNIYKVSKGILNNKCEIEDAIQNTIIKAYNNIKFLKDDKYFKTWIIRILINECNDVLRKNKRIVSLQDNVVDENYYDEYENIDLVTAINSLQEDLRSTTVLFYYEDLSIKDISSILEIPEGTVRSRLTRARQKLRGILGEV